MRINALGRATPGSSRSQFGTTILAPRDAVVHGLRMERFLREGERPLLGKWVELSALHRGGCEVPIEMTVWIVSIDGCHTFNAFIRDLTKRTEIETALRDSARLQTLVDGVRDVIILTDLYGIIVYTSPSARSVLGFESDELYGHNLDEFVHAEDREAFARTLDRATKARGEMPNAQRMLARDGGHVWMESTTSVVRDDATGHITGLEIVSRDITRRKLAEETRKRATVELARTNQVLRAAVAHEQELVEELQKMDRLKTDFVSMVSHELRTPLTSISGYVEMLVDPAVGLLSNRQRTMLDVVERNTRRLLLMIENLLTLGGIEAGGFDVDPVPLGIYPHSGRGPDNATDRGGARDHGRPRPAGRHHFRARRCTSARPGAAESPVERDQVHNGRWARDGLQQARRCGRRSRRDRHRRRGAHRRAIQAVHAFLPLVGRDTASRTRNRSWTRDRQEHHRSPRGNDRSSVGTRRRNRRLVHLARRVRRGTAQCVRTPTRRTTMQSILIIDDDPDIRELISFKLEQLGFEVHTESDGETGLAAVMQLQPDLVLLDWMMPKLTGIEVCSLIRDGSDNVGVPVIMLTARAQEADIQRGFAAGADDYIVKPFSPRELASRVEAVLARVS